MFRLFSLLALGLAALCTNAGVAGAQSTLDMKGTWTGTSKSIVSGLAAYHPAGTPAKAGGQHRLTEVTFTITIGGQQDVRFWGTLGSPAKIGPVIGVISPDSKRIRMVAENGGVIEGTVLDNDTIEIFYFEHNAGVSVAATNLFKRQK